MAESQPPVPPDADLRGLPGFMLDTARLLGSELWALSTGDQFKAAMALWCRAWQQVPAGSLPDDDAVLKAFSGAGSKWPKVRDVALRGFVKCSDGRLYHTVLCQDVNRAIESKRKRHERVQAAVSARKKQRDNQRDVERDDEQNHNVTTSHNRTGQDRTEERKKDSAATAADAGASAEPEILPPASGEIPDIPGFLDRRHELSTAPPDPKKIIFDQGLNWLSDRSSKTAASLRPYLGKLCRDHGDAMTAAAIVDAQKNNPVDPIAWMEKYLGKSKPGKRDAFVAALLGEPA